MGEQLIASTTVSPDYLREEEIAEIEHERTLYPDTARLVWKH